MYIIIHWLRLRLVGVKTGRMEKEKWKTGKKIMFSLIWFRKENTKDGKYWEKKIHRAHKYLSSRFGRKSGKKREKSGVSTWITYLPPWCVIWKFFLFFIFYFILLWELVCLWLVSQVLDSLSFLPFFFLILFFCVRKTPFLFSIVLVFSFWNFFLGSWTSYPLFILFF